jgi:DNA-binding transcriptional LysR family regulator
MTLFAAQANAEVKLAIDDYYYKIAPYIVQDFQRLYREIGEDVEVAVVPGERAIQQTVNGYYQALDARFRNPIILQNLLIVDVPIYTSADQIVYAINLDIRIDKIKDIANYQAVSILGSAVTTQFINEYDLKILQVNTLEQAVKMVETGRADILLVANFYINRLKSTGKGLNLTPVSPALSSEWVYHHVHESRAHLVPKLEAKIRELQETEGLFHLR